MKRKFDDTTAATAEEETSDEIVAKGSEEQTRKRLKTEGEQHSSCDHHQHRECPYLDTINRKMIDFDMDRICSQTLSDKNVFACLTCGKFYSGRNESSAAYDHSISADHHVFISLDTSKIYCLPDNYEVQDASLMDLRHNIDPQYSQEQIATIGTVSTPVVSVVTGEKFIPGFIALNNLKHTDGINATVQALARVALLRSFFLDKHNTHGQKPKSRLAQSFGLLLRKMFNHRAFRSRVSPNDFVLAVSDASERRFKVGSPNDPADFLVWLLNTLNSDLSQKKGPAAESIITDVFRGKVSMTSQMVRVTTDDDAPRIDPTLLVPSTRAMPFLFLTVDVPPAPLFQADQREVLVPQMPLYSLLSKFDGKTQTRTPVAATPGVVEQKTFQIVQLPRYLVIHIKRFTKNAFTREKNQTIVTFPVQNLDMRDYISQGQPQAVGSTQYNLVANIRHEGKADAGIYKVHVRTPQQTWLDISDTGHIHQVEAAEVTTSEGYILIYENSSVKSGRQ